jgi:hypothetical protein
LSFVIVIITIIIIISPYSVVVVSWRKTGQFADLAGEEVSGNDDK